jgi:hypothetical protein
MKTKEELQKYIREEVSNPLIGKFIMEMTDKGISYEDTMQMAKILIDNTPNVENKMVADHLIKRSIIDEDSNIITTKIEEFADIADLHGFETQFCLYEVENVNALSGITADYMTNGLDDNQIQLENKELTWLELWAAADNLYKKIGDTEHLFVEEFEVIQNGDKTEVQVFFGS